MTSGGDIFAAGVRRRSVGGRVLVPGLLAIACALPAADGVPPADTSADQKAAQQQAAARARAFASEAATAVSAGEFDRARTLYRSALALDPGLAEARTGLSSVEAILAGRQAAAADPAGLPAALPADLEGQRESETRLALAQADALSAAKRWREAIDVLDAARTRIIGLDRQGRLRDMGAEIERRLVDYRRAETAGATVGATVDRAQAAQAASDERGRDTAGARSILLERLARIRAVRDHGHLELALAHARRLVSDYPGEKVAEDLNNELLAAVHERRRLDLKERSREVRQEIAERIERSLIPTGQNGMPQYPQDWRDRHVGGTNELDLIPAVPAWKEAILGHLVTRISLDVNAQNGVEVLNQLARQAGVNLIIDPEVMAAGERPVTLKASGVTFESALNWITRLMDTSWIIADGAIAIGGKVSEPPLVRIYDATAALFQARDFPGREVGLAGLGGAGGAAAAAPAAPAPGATANDLVETIKKIITPTIWANPANGLAVVTGNRLVVTAPADTQRQVLEYLRAQERSRSLLVKVDLHWLSINDGYLEQIGVQWNTQNSLLQSQNHGLERFNNTSYTTASTWNQLPAVAVQQPNAGAGLNLSLSLLRSANLYPVLTAIEQSGQGRVLAATSVVTLNGVRANCQFLSQFSYIQGYDVVGGNFDPKIAVLNTGFTLDVQPYVSADRRSVTLDLDPMLSSATNFNEVLIAPRILPGRGGDGKGDGDGAFIEPGRTFPIDLVNVSRRSARTTAKIADGSSLIISGFGNTVEQQAATRVPVLGSIPFLGRLFGQRGRYSNRTKTFLTASVAVIDFNALEARL